MERLEILDKEYGQAWETVEDIMNDLNSEQND